VLRAHRTCADGKYDKTPAQQCNECSKRH
jgi:hypothetical protein